MKKVPFTLLKNLVLQQEKRQLKSNGSLAPHGKLLILDVLEKRNMYSF